MCKTTRSVNGAILCTNSLKTFEISVDISCFSTYNTIVKRLRAGRPRRPKGRGTKVSSRHSPHPSINVRDINTEETASSYHV